jgi:hypothetical protein
MAFSCKFFGQIEMAESFEALIDITPDIEKLVVLNNMVNETWKFIIAMRFDFLVLSFASNILKLLISLFDKKK